MRYFRVEWTDAAGAVRLSEPLPSWTVAEEFRRSVGGIILSF